ncbi:hypothetical protein AAIH17_34970, partial [Pseudomonas aeruginosa]
VEIVTDDIKPGVAIGGTTFPTTSAQVASMILDHYQRFGGDGERFSAVECCGTDEYLYPGLVGKKFFSCTIFANISIWEAVLLRINS